MESHILNIYYNQVLTHPIPVRFPLLQNHSSSFNSSKPFQSNYLVVLSFELPPNDEYVLLNFMLSQRNKAILKHKFTLEEGELLLVATISDPASWANATRIILPALRR